MTVEVRWWLIGRRWSSITRSKGLYLPATRPHDSVIVTPAATRALCAFTSGSRCVSRSRIRSMQSPILTARRTSLMIAPARSSTLLLLRDLAAETGSPTLADIHAAGAALFQARADEAQQLGLPSRAWPPTVTAMPTGLTTTSGLPLRPTSSCRSTRLLPRSTPGSPSSTDDDAGRISDRAHRGSCERICEPNAPQHPRWCATRCDGKEERLTVTCMFETCGAKRNWHRLAHNPEVAGSNPVPATTVPATRQNGPRRILRGSFSCRMATYLATLARSTS
jgi:hypothetical protein